MDGEPRLPASALMTSAELLPHEAQGAVRTPLVAELRKPAQTHDLPAYRWVCEARGALGLITIRLAQGRAAHLEPVVRGLHRGVRHPVAVAHALVLARLGQLEEATAVPLPDTAALPIGHLLSIRDQFARTTGAAYATLPLAQASERERRPTVTSQTARPGR